MRRRPALLAVLLASLPVLQALGQATAPILAPGARVRWVLEGDQAWYVGTITQARLDTLLVQRTDSGQTLKVLASELRELDLSRGQASRGRGAVKGARIGFVAGVGVAFMTAVATGCLNGGYQPFNPQASNNAHCIRWGAAGIVAGATVAGGLIGHALPPREDWVRIPLSQLQLGVAPRQGRVIIRL